VTSGALEYLNDVWISVSSLHAGFEWTQVCMRVCFVCVVFVGDRAINHTHTYTQNHTHSLSLSLSLSPPPPLSLPLSLPLPLSLYTTQVTAAAPFAARAWFGAASYGQSVLVAGGATYKPMLRLNDVWKSNGFFLILCVSSYVCVRASSCGSRGVCVCIRTHVYM
jgi:hypothetical protein